MTELVDKRVHWPGMAQTDSNSKQGWKIISGEKIDFDFTLKMYRTRNWAVRYNQIKID